MMPPGLDQVLAAKQDGRWEQAYSMKDLQVPEDFLQVLEQHPSAKQFYQTLPKSSRVLIANGLQSAKRPETRQRRFDMYLDKLRRHERP